MIEGSQLYQRQIANCGDRLMHKVWDNTPWMVNAYTGSPGNEDERWGEVMDWCRERFGPEAWPIHGKPGNWRSGGAIVFGWNWMGFATEAMMRQFMEAWPAPPGTDQSLKAPNPPENKNG